jgi:hypothetical protein
MFPWILSDGYEAHLHLLVDCNWWGDTAEIFLDPVLVLFFEKFSDFLNDRDDLIVNFLRTDDEDSSSSVQIADDLLFDLLLHADDGGNGAEEGYRLLVGRVAQVFILVNEGQATAAV